MRLFIYSAVLFLLFFHYASGYWTVDLTKTIWSARSEDTKKDGRGTITVSSILVPGDIFMDLYRAKLIDDPYKGDNDVKLRWVGERNWTYSTKFELTSAQLEVGLFYLLKALRRKTTRTFIASNCRYL